MANNPFAGHVPMHLVKSKEQAGKATSYKGTSYQSGKRFGVFYRDQYTDHTIAPRNAGCQCLRRYPNGILDYRYVADQIIDAMHKVKDGGVLTELEKAILCLVLPKEFSSLVDEKIAQTMTRLSNDERLVLASLVSAHLLEELNWNAGRGGGSVLGRSTSRG